MKPALDCSLIIEAVESVLKEHRTNTLALHEPHFAGNEWTYVKECLDTSWVSSVGKYVDLFERKLEKITGVKKAIACTNGTAALHACLILAGVEPNNEVLMPTLTFVATANAISYCSAIPHFVESEPTSLGVCPRKLEHHLKETAVVRDGFCYNKLTGRCIRALIVMHAFGHPADLDELTRVCQKYELELIEDAAESLGSFYKRKHTGNWGKLTALSFNGNKVVTTGGGGAILTNDEKLGSLAKHITTTAKKQHTWAFDHDSIGFNYRMPNLNAALGCAQLEQLDTFLKQKRSLARKYADAFQSISSVTFLNEPIHTVSNYWLNTILLPDTANVSELSNQLLQEFHNRRILCRPAWTPMHLLKMYKNCPRAELSFTEQLASRVVSLPSSVILA